jgi:hypothetical protein
VFPLKCNHGEGDLMVLSKFGTLIIMTILHYQYEQKIYETYGWIPPLGRFVADTSMVDID